MSTAGINFGGLASGLDTQAIIRALVSVERAPILQMEQKTSDLQRQKSLFGTLDGLLDKLSESVQKLKRTSDFLTMSATSSDEETLTASASSAALAGSYDVRVLALATGQVNTAGAASPADPLPNTNATVSMEIDVGGQAVTVTADNNLDAIAAAINAEAETTGVRAEVVDTGAGNPNASERYQLVVRSEQPGAANGFTLSYVDGGGGFQDLVDALVDPANQTDASDAQIEVNGVIAYRSTNTVSDLLDGVTLDLRSVPDPQRTVTITVATDAEATGENVEDFVNAYNELVDFFEAQNRVSDQGSASSPLFGDTTLRSIRSSLRGIVGGSFSSGNTAYQMLSQIGVTSDTDGKLTFDQSEFQAALDDDDQAVTAMFADSAAGLAGMLEDRIDIYTDSVDGLIKIRNDGYDRRIKQTRDRIDDAERRLSRYEERLTKKYANLEQLLTRLQGQGSSLGAMGQPRA